MLRMLTVLMALAAAIPAQAQDWPTRPMTMIVPFAAGGAVDVLARALGARTAEILGQQIIIENVAGAGGMIGTNSVAKAAPDGYTFCSAAWARVRRTRRSTKRRPMTRRRTSSRWRWCPSCRYCWWRRDLPANDLQEFIAYAKAKDGKMQFGSAGVGSAVHLGCVLFNAAAGIQATHIPYRGGGPAMQDLVAGRIDYTCNIITSALPNVKSNQIKAMANLAPKRTPLLPDLQDLAGAGPGQLRRHHLEHGAAAQGNARADRAEAQRSA